MKFFLTLSLLFVIFQPIAAQEQVVFNHARSKAKLPFKLVNNLIILPVSVNGIELNFLLDTGVEETILFSLDEKKELELYKVEKIKLKGLGTQEAVEGLKSYHNNLSIGNLEFKNQEIIIVLDQSFNFSSSLGIEVNGILGYHFFKSQIVEFDYIKRKIIVYNPKKFNAKKVLSNFQAFDFTLENGKPYVLMQVDVNNSSLAAKCLIDSGNSDGLWLFQTQENEIKVPDKNFDDYLGRGFSGAIYGKKAKVKQLSLGEFKLEQVITAFPDSVSLANVNLVDNRSGSIGGAVLKRFNAIFDYGNQKLYLKKNKFYAEKFTYNATGIAVQHAGMQWSTEQIPVKSFETKQESLFNKENAQLNYNFKLLPVYEIFAVRKNSAAERAGLKSGDVLVSINGKDLSRLSLDKVNRLLELENNGLVKIQLTRKGVLLQNEFEVKDLL